MRSQRPHPLRRGAIPWPVLVFLVVFTLLLIVITPYVLVPGLEAIQEPADTAATAAATTTTTATTTATTAPATATASATSAAPTTAAAKARLTPEEKRSLQAWYRLLLFVLLFILFAGIVLTFRFGRLFLPRPATPRTQTKYVDAWAESARRMQVPPADEDPP